MELLRNTIKEYFNTGDTPTEAQFAELIDSGFDLHQFTYRADYPYEEGNLVISSETYIGGGGQSNTTWFVYKRTSYLPGTTGESISNTLYWTKIIGGVNIFNVPIINPNLPPIKAPFNVFNQSKELLGSTYNNTDTINPLNVGDVLYFEERVYNMPGTYKYKWSIYRNGNPTAVEEKETRDIFYSFSQAGNYTVTLQAWEYGFDDNPYSSSVSLSVEETLTPDMSFNITVNPSNYSYQNQSIAIVLTWENTGNIPLTSIITALQIGNGDTTTINVGSLAVGEITSQTTTYTITVSDMGTQSLNVVGSATAQSSNGTVNRSDQETLTNQLVYGNIGITMDALTYLTAYSNKNFNLPVSAVFNPSIANRVAQATYMGIRLTCNSTQRTSVVPIVSIPSTIEDGINFSYTFLNVNHPNTGTGSLVLRYVDPWTQESLSSPALSFYLQSAIDVTIQSITLNDDEDAYTVILRGNKGLNISLTNTYSVWEKIEGGEWAEVTVSPKEGTTTLTFEFDTELLDDETPTTYYVKVVENLGEKGQNDSSESIDEYPWTLLSKIYWGEIVDSTIPSVLFGVNKDTAWNDHFVPLRFSETYPWRDYDDFTNRDELTIAFQSGTSQGNWSRYPFVAFPKIVGGDPSTGYPEYTLCKGTLDPSTRSISTMFFVLEKTIDGVDYFVYTLKGGGTAGDLHGNAADPGDIIFIKE